jgi:2-furoate---CoA ligase
VVGLADERWGKVVSAFVKRHAAVEADDLEQFCRSSGLANFKRPRRYVFVATIPKSPVGKLLRRKLVAGEYEPERPMASSGEAETGSPRKTRQTR